MENSGLKTGERLGGGVEELFYLFVLSGAMAEQLPPSPF